MNIFNSESQIKMLFFVGLIGAIRENRCLLIAFSSILGLLICIEIALSVALLALAKERNLGAVVQDKMTASMNHYKKEGYDGVTKGKTINYIFHFSRHVYNIRQCLIHFIICFTFFSLGCCTN